MRECSADFGGKSSVGGRVLRAFIHCVGRGEWSCVVYQDPFVFCEEAWPRRRSEKRRGENHLLGKPLLQTGKSAKAAKPDKALKEQKVVQKE